MVPIKDQYIHYEKAGDQFVGRSFTSISSLTTEFGVSPVHQDWADSPVGSKDEILALIKDNFTRRTGFLIQSSIFYNFYSHEHDSL